MDTHFTRHVSARRAFLLHTQGNYLANVLECGIERLSLRVTSLKSGTFGDIKTVFVFSDDHGKLSDCFM